MSTEPHTSSADLSGTAPDPQACEMLICGGRVLDLAIDAGALDHSAIAIRAGFIVAVGDETNICKAWRPVRRIDASGHVVATGFVDAHVHLSAYLGAGRDYRITQAPGPSRQIGDRQMRFKARKPLKGHRNDNSQVLANGEFGEWTPHDLRRTAAASRHHQVRAHPLGKTPELGCPLYV